MSLRVIECKSLLDSTGVDCAAFNGTKPAFAKRYKLFCDATLRRVVLRRLEKQLVSAGFCPNDPVIKLCLAAGNIRSDEPWLRQYFDSQGWILMGPELIREELTKLRDTGYENSIAAVVAKLLLRDGRRAKRPKRGIDAAT